MLLTKSYQILFVILLSVAVIGCDSSTEPELSESDQYFHIGDISQYYYQNSNDYSQDKIIGKTKRSDGLEVYILEYKLKTPDTTYVGEDYVFVRDGYYYYTALGKTADPDYIDVNPFTEFKSFKINLEQGDSWQAIQGQSDSNKIVYSVDFVGQLETPAGIFNDVYSINSYIKSLGYNVSMYYSKEYGILGTRNDLQPTMLVYIKKQNTELGERVEF